MIVIGGYHSLLSVWCFKIYLELCFIVL